MRDAVTTTSLLTGRPSAPALRPTGLHGACSAWRQSTPSPPLKLRQAWGVPTRPVGSPGAGKRPQAELGDRRRAALTPGRQAVDLQRQLLQDRHRLEGVVHGGGGGRDTGPCPLPARAPGGVEGAGGSAQPQAPASGPFPAAPAAHTPRLRFRAQAPPTLPSGLEGAGSRSAPVPAAQE